jgi:hypothetical protein
LITFFVTFYNNVRKLLFKHIKVNGILFAKKTFKGTLQTGESFMIGTSQPNRTLIPMTLEKVLLSGN